MKFNFPCSYFKITGYEKQDYKVILTWSEICEINDRKLYNSKAKSNQTMSYCENWKRNSSPSNRFWFPAKPGSLPDEKKLSEKEIASGLA